MKKNFETKNYKNRKTRNLRCKHNVGVNKRQILEDARKLKGTKLSRLNLLTKQNIRNIEFKFKESCNNKLHDNDMTATAIKMLN